MPDAPAQPGPSPPRWYARTVWWATLVCLVIILGSNVVRNSIILKSYWALGLLLAGAAWAPALRGGNLIGRWSVRQWLLGVIGLALILRVACVLVTPYTPTADFRVYHEAGLHMAEHWELRTGPYRCFFPPGQIFALGVVYSIFGENVLAAQLLNVIWATLTVGAVYVFARCLVEDRAARIASLTAAVLPSAVFSCVVLGAEVPQNFWFFLALCFYAAVFERRDRLWGALACGLCLGVAALIRPTFLLVPFALGLHLLIARRRRLRVLAGAGLMLLGVALAVAPWTYRNYRVTGGFVLLSSNGGGNLWSGNNPETTYGRYTDSVWRHLYGTCHDDLSIHRTGMERGTEWIRNNPGEFAWLAVCKAIVFWATDADMAWWAVDRPALDIPGFGWPRVVRRIVVGATSGFFVACVGAGIVGLVRRRRWLKASRGWLVIPVLCAYFTAVHMVFESQAKYHYMLTPLICILAALAFRAGPGDARGKAGPIQSDT